MLLKDQYPISIDKSNEIDFVDNGVASVNSKTGVLIWKSEVKPGETKTYRFRYVVKYTIYRIVNFN